MIWALWVFVGFVVGGVCYGFNLGVAIGVWAFRGFGFGVLRVGTLFPMGLVWVCGFAGFSGLGCGLAGYVCLWGWGTIGFWFG